MARKKAEGKRVGGVPYGFSLSDDGESLIPNPSEHEVAVYAYGCHKDGLGYNAIARALSTKGVRTRTGRKFQAVQVKRMIVALAEQKNRQQGGGELFGGDE